MSKLNFIDVHKGNFLSNWSKIAKFRKPLIAAVNGFAVHQFLIYLLSISWVEDLN